MNDFIVSLLLLGAMSSSDGNLPYWMTTNQYGLMPERNGGMALVQARTEFDESKTWQWRWGASLAANCYDTPKVLDLACVYLPTYTQPTVANGNLSTVSPLTTPVFQAHVLLDQLYASLRWKVFTLDVGQKHRENDFLGASPALGSLSVTGGHLVESGNARSMPGYLVTLDPVAVPWTGRHLLVSGAYGDYATTDNRYVRGALVHRMRVGLHGEITERLSLSATLDHYALWAGDHPDPEREKIAISLGNYFRVITGSHAGADGTMSDRINVIGDHGGSEILRAQYRGEGWTLTAQHDIPYADGSGMGFQNFPDGVNTIHFGWNDKDRWISDILYEHQYTMYQSGTFNDEAFDEDGNSITPPGASTVGGDNYFNNGYYRSGWTHYGATIGDPLLLPSGKHDGSWSSVLTNKRMENTRLKAHHLALGGKLWRRHPYKLMLTYSHNFGTYGAPYVGESQWNHEWGTVHEIGLKQLSGAFVGTVGLGKGSGRGSFGGGHRAFLDGMGITYGVYFDKGELYRDSFGATLGIRCTLGR